MQNLFENLINHNRQLDERQAAEKASVHPRHDSHVFDLSTVTRSTLLTQDLSDLVAKLPFDYMLKILYGNLDTGAKCSTAELARAGITDHDFGLHEHTVGAVRRMINRQVSGFTPYVTDRSYREKSLGWYQLNAEKVPALRERKPIISVTQVSATKVFPARLMMACSKSTIDRAYAGEMSDTIPGLSQATIIKADNTLSLPLEPRYMVLVPNLLCWDGDNRCQYAWDLIRSLFRNRFDATALDHLYWAYNRASVSWKPAITPPTAGPDPMPFFDLFLDFPAGRESMNGIIRHSVWHEGGPVGSDRIIATMFALLGIKSAVGPFPSKISAWLRDIVLYGSSFRSPDPAAGVTLNFMDPKKFTDVKADVFWAPSLDQAGSVGATTIAIPVSSPDQVCSVASKFLKDELKYGVDVTYGANPTVWVTQTNDGYSPKEAGVYVRKMAVSVYWMSMWNISNAAVGRVDIWHAGVRPSCGMVFSQTTALLTYCYVPLQAKAEQAPIYTKSATDFSLSKLNALVRTNLIDPPKKVLVRKEESSVVEGPQNATPQQPAHQAPPSPQPSPNGQPQVFQFGQDAFAQVSQLVAQHPDTDGDAPMESG